MSAPALYINANAKADQSPSTLSKEYDSIPHRAAGQKAAWGSLLDSERQVKWTPWNARVKLLRNDLWFQLETKPGLSAERRLVGFKRPLRNLVVQAAA